MIRHNKKISKQSQWLTCFEEEIQDVSPYFLLFVFSACGPDDFIWFPSCVYDAFPTTGNMGNRKEGRGVRSYAAGSNKGDKDIWRTLCKQ